MVRKPGNSDGTLVASTGREWYCNVGRRAPRSRAMVAEFGNLSVSVTGTVVRPLLAHFTHGPPAPEHRSTTVLLPDCVIVSSNRVRIGSYVSSKSVEICKKSVKPSRMIFGHQDKSW